MARPRQVTDEAIFAAVREVVAEHGPKVSTSVIAAKLGLSQAALFKRFGTKEALLVRGLAPHPPSELFVHLAGGPTAERPLDEQLADLALQLFKMMREMMPRIQALRACGYEPQNIFKHFDVPPPIQGVRALEAWFGVGRDRGLVRANVDVNTLAKVVMGSLFFESHLHNIAGEWMPESDAEAHIRGVVDVVCMGIVAEAA